jgi:hypothetical protein
MLRCYPTAPEYCSVIQLLQNATVLSNCSRMLWCYPTAPEYCSVIQLLQNAAVFRMLQCYPTAPECCSVQNAAVLSNCSRMLRCYPTAPECCSVQNATVLSNCSRMLQCYPTAPECYGVIQLLQNAAVLSNCSRMLRCYPTAPESWCPNLPKVSHVTPLLITLRCLPVEAHIVFKTLVLVNRVSKGNRPSLPSGSNCTFQPQQSITPPLVSWPSHPQGRAAPAQLSQSSSLSWHPIGGTCFPLKSGQRRPCPSSKTSYEEYLKELSQRPISIYLSARPSPCLYLSNFYLSA